MFPKQTRTALDLGLIVTVGVVAGLGLALLLQPALLAVLLPSLALLLVAGLLLLPTFAVVVLLLCLCHAHAPLARAEHAFHGGRLGAALALAARAGREDRLLAYLQVRLPLWAAKAEVLAATRELLALQRSVALAARSGVSATLTAGIAQDTAAALDQLWQRADRFALVAAQRPDPATMAPLMAAEAEQLTRLAAAATRARDGLALATLRGGAAWEPLRLGLDLRADQARDLSRW